MRLPLINVKNVHLSRSGNKMHNKTKNKVGDQLRLSTKSTKIEKGLIECQLWNFMRYILEGHAVILALDYINFDTKIFYVILNCELYYGI